MSLRVFYVCMSRFYRHPKPLLALLFLSTMIVVLGVFKLFFHHGQQLKPIHTVYTSFLDSNRKIQGSIEIYGLPPAELENKETLRHGKCILPDLDVHHKGIMEYISDFGELKCEGESYGYLNNGKLRVTGSDIGNVVYNEVLFEPNPTNDREKKRFKLGEEKYIQKNEEISKELLQGRKGSIQHVKGRCIHPFGGLQIPEDGTEVVLWQDCGLERIEFEFTQEGFFRHELSKKCIRTKGGILKAEINTPLVFSTECDEAAKFVKTIHNTIGHVASGLCIHDLRGSDDPPDDSRLVLRGWCDKEFLRYFWFNPRSSSGNSLDRVQDVHEDFIKVNLQLPRKPACCRDISEHLLQVYPKADALNRKQRSGRNFDVLLIMLRSTSYAHFQRKMPNTFNFLTNEMKAVMFKGFSSVGESAISQLSAMLAGLTPTELVDKSIDEMPWIFKKFEDDGYVTMFSEDKAASAEFKDTLGGFQRQPVDHFAEPYWSSVSSSDKDPGNTHLCFGSRAVHNLSLSYMESFFTAYGADRNKFGMVLNSEMSFANPLNTMGYMDEDLMATLRRMKQNGNLDRTFLFVFSNHGMSTGRFRETLQGKLEERSPLLMISLPTDLTNFAEVQKNLFHNREMLISPYDIYATLNHIGDQMRTSLQIRGHSILNKLDLKFQECTVAGIPKVWCPCLSSNSLSTEGPYVQRIAEYVVETMNYRLDNNTNAKQRCGKLKLGKVNILERITPNDLVLSFKYSRSNEKCLSCEPVVSKSSSEKVHNDLLYRIQISISPGNNIYESQVNVLNEQILSCSNTKLVSGEIGKCLTEGVEEQSLKEICICN